MLQLENIIPTTFYVLTDNAESSSTLLGVDFLEEIELRPPQRKWYFTDESHKQFPYMEETQPR